MRNLLRAESGKMLAKMAEPSRSLDDHLPRPRRGKAGRRWQPI